MFAGGIGGIPVECRSVQTLLQVQEIDATFKSNFFSNSSSSMSASGKAIKTPRRFVMTSSPREGGLDAALAH